MKLETVKEKLNRWHFGILALIFILAVLLRVIGADWGMPYRNLHPDEGLVFENAYQCAYNHDFEVHEYYRPNHVLIKLNTLLYVGIQELYFAPRGQMDFAMNYNGHFALFTTASRLLIALFGLGTVVMAYLIGRFLGREEALLSALIFAVFPSFIEHSHYITPEVPLLFFLMGVLWAALHYHEKPSVTWLFWMAFFTALATCEKYPGAYGCAIIAVTVIVTHIKKPMMIIKHGLLSICFFVLGIMAVSPVLVIDYRNVLEVMAGQNKEHHLGADGLNFGQTILYYLKTTWVHMGLILTACSVYGVWKAFRKNAKQTMILLAFFAYIVPISTLKIHWERYTLPIYAVGILFGAMGAICILQDLPEVFRKKIPLVLTIFLVVILLPVTSLFAGSVAVTASFLAPDSRILLQDVFAGIGVTVDNTAFDCNTPLDPGGYYGAFGSFEDGDPTRPKYGNGPRFVMTSSAQRDLYLAADPEVYGWIAQFYRSLDEEYSMVYYYPVETPSCHFLELQNLWYAARSVHRYMKGAATGYEIRLYQLMP